MWTFHFWAALVVCLCSLGHAFNLEPRIPVVKKGSPKSHFGYSVAQHQTIIKTPVGLDREFRKSWILVGAPKDHNLQPGTTRSGALWKCPVSTNTTDCVQVHTDGYKGPGGQLMPPNEDEMKDDQWMGVTLKSQGPGGLVLVCAHRYMYKRQNSEYGFGLCYVLSQSLDLEDTLEPCKGKPVDKEHEQWGYCQAGTSGLILEDEVVLGIPGPYTWRGTIHTSNVTEDFLMRDKTQYFGPVTENESPVYKYSYLGYSVSAGHFFSKTVSYVGGAPRSNGTGQVVFFSKEKLYKSLLLVDFILNGEMFASSYGFEVLGVDLNGDSWDDLVVGAPFYYTKHTSGAIYVYNNNQKGFTENHPFLKIEGSAGESRFGFSLASLGDLNRDGYNDLAVGAPYEDKGAIYIFLGSKDGLISEPSQIIRAQDLPGTPYNAFGYALSGGMDLDNNGYPDLLASSFCSDRVLLIRARPIIDIQTMVKPEKNLQNIDPTKKGCSEDRSSSMTCFSFEACFKMDSIGRTRTSLELDYMIVERVYKDSPRSRIHFQGTPKQNFVKRRINLRPNEMGKHQCSREVVYLRMSYEIIQRDPRPVPEGTSLPDIDDFPILNQQEAVRDFEATFAKDCGPDDICKSDLRLKADLDLPLDEMGQHYVLELGQRQSTFLSARVKNLGEGAYLANLYVFYYPSFFFSAKDSEVDSYHCTSLSGLSIVHCSLGNPFTNETALFLLAFKPSGQPFQDRFVDFSVVVNSTSNEISPNDEVHLRAEVVKRAEVSIIGSVNKEQIFYGGNIIGESAIEFLDNIGEEVHHKYVIDNRGPWKVDSLQVKVLWPLQVENNKKQGKWLLYMTDYPTIDGDGECEIDPSYVNPLILRRFQPSIGHVEGEQEISITPKQRKNITLASDTVTLKKTISTVKKTETSNIKHYGSSTSLSEKKSAQTDDLYSETDDDYWKRSHQETSQSGYSNSLYDADFDKESSTKSSRKSYSYSKKESKSGDSDWKVDYERESYFENGQESDNEESVKEFRNNARSNLNNWKAHNNSRAEGNRDTYGSYRHNYSQSGFRQGWHPDEHNDYYSRREKTGVYSNNWKNSDSQHQEENDYYGEYQSDGRTFMQTVVDDNTGKASVYSRQTFDNIVRHKRDILSENSRWQLIRRKREKEVLIKPEAITDTQTGKVLKVVNFQCDGEIPTAKCFSFRCNIRNLGANQAASIRIVSRLWNSTLVEDYPRVNRVSIRSKAFLLLPPDIRDDQNVDDDIASAETLAYPDLLDQHPTDEIPLWVILVAIFAGLLVLILISLILWKIGFFERKRPDPTLSGNLDKDVNGY